MAVETAGSARVVETVPPPRDGMTHNAWWPVLEACRRVTRARSAIAVGDEGLALSWVGDLDRVGADRVAAHVARAFDLLDRLKYIGSLAECVCVRFVPEEQWLTAVRVAPKAGTEITIALIGRYTLVERGRQRLRNTFLRVWEETRIR